MNISGTKKDITKRKTPIYSTLKSLMGVYLKRLIFRVIRTLKVETCSGTLTLVSKFVVPVPVWRSVTRPRPHYVVLYVTDFITSAMVATVAEIDSGSTLHDTCLTTEVQKSFTKPTIFHGATPAEFFFAAPLQVSFT